MTHIQICLVLGALVLSVASVLVSIAPKIVGPPSRSAAGCVMKIIINTGGHQKRPERPHPVTPPPVKIASIEQATAATDAVLVANADVERNTDMSVVHAITWELPEAAIPLQFRVVAKDQSGATLAEIKVPACPVEVTLPEGADVTIEVAAFNKSGRFGPTASFAFRTERSDEVIPEPKNIQQTFVRFEPGPAPA